MADLDIKQTVEDIAKGFTALRTEVDAVKSRDVVTEEKFGKMSDEITAKLAAVQEKQAKLEAAMSRQDADLKSSDKDAGRAELDNYLRKGIAPEGVKISQAEGLEIRSMRTDSQPDGGFLVRPQLANFVIDRIFETSPMRTLASSQTVSGAILDILIDDQEAGFRWVAQGPSGGETNKPLLGQKSIAVHKMEADPRISTEMLEDSYLDVEGWLSRKVAERFARGENTSFVVGSGVGQPRGFLTYPNWASAGVYQRDAVERINSGNATLFTADSFIRVQNAQKEAYQAGSSWVMKRQTFGSVLQLKSTDNYHFMGLTVAPGNQNVSMTILGKSVTFMDDMPVTGASNLSVAYADWRRFYTIVDRVGIQVLRDPYTNKGFVTYYTYKRTGGDVTSFDAAKIMVNAV